MWNTLLHKLGLSHKHVHAIKHHWLTLSFFWGFIVDNFTLVRVDKWYDVALLASYVIISMTALLLLYAATAGKLPERLNPFFREYSAIAIQFVFGGLLSGMLIFYGRSADWLVSWPYMLVIVLVVAGNELIHDRTKRLVYSLSMLFVGLFSFLVLMIPVFTGVMGDLMFVGDGFLAFLIMLGYIHILRKIVPNFIGMHTRPVYFAIIMLYLGLNFLYFANLIPPVPLNLKEIGIYHSVVHFDSGQYQLTYEQQPWWQFWRKSDTTFHYKPGDNIYCFASVFAPTNLSATIYHKWERYDEQTKKWIYYGRFSYPIFGGRDGGYRGFTNITARTDGKWRCTVEIARGQVLGSETFTSVEGQPQDLVKRTE